MRGTELIYTITIRSNPLLVQYNLIFETPVSKTPCIGVAMWQATAG